MHCFWKTQVERGRWEERDIIVDNKGRAKCSVVMKCLLVLFSYHHNNTEKVARVFSRVLDAEIKTPEQVDPEDLQEYDLVGFGSGIYDEKHHPSLLDLADRLPQVNDKKAFLFSTTGVPANVSGESYISTEVRKAHTPLREKLESKGYVIVDEFICAGFNTNSFLRYFGGINKGRPNAEDLKHAEEFAKNLMNSHE